MKISYFLTIASFLLIRVGLMSQTVYTDPLFPQADEPVTVFFNAEGTPLEGYTGDLYTHTGVGIEGQGNWQYVIGNWGDNSTQPELTSLGNDLWELEMTPSIRDFYSVNASQEIINMSFVFRTADANQQTGDLFLQVFSSEFSIIFSSPAESEITVLENEVIYLEAVSLLADSMFLFINEELVYSTNEVVLSYEITATGAYGFWADIPLDVMAVNATDTIVESGSYKVIPLPTTEALPAGIIDGINYIDNNTVILSLFAPGKEYAFVIGEFNDWTIVEAHYMKRTPDEERFWIQVDGLAEGVEYAFQYIVDGSIKISDPYSHLILDPWNDQYIPEENYPNLKPYPSGQEGPVTVLQTNQDEYGWQHDDFVPPAKTDLVVYELLVRDFTHARNYQTIIDTLNYLKTLGVNAIELMPVNEFDGNISWGYNPNHFFAVDKAYGTRNDLKAFVDACHGHGMAVILDVVYNHATNLSPYVKLYWDENAGRPSEESPFYNQEPTHDFNVFSDMNHESEASRAYIKRAVRYWLEEYHVDGYRFDLSKGFTQNNTLGDPNAMAQYDQSRIDIIMDYAEEGWSVNPDAYMILEHFADNSEETVLANSGCMIWGNSNYNYNEGTMGYNENGKSDFSWISYQERGWDEPHVMGYMESHDEERLMYKNLTYGKTSNPEHNVQDSVISLRRQQLAASFFITIPGPKMIWQFGELGYDYSRYYDMITGQVIEGDDGIKVDPKPVRWDYLEDWRREVLYKLYAELIKLKTSEPAFKTTDFDLTLGGAMKNIHLNHSSMNVTVLGNFDVEEGNIVPNFQHTGWWYDYFAGDSIEVTDVSATIPLDPGEYRLYTDKKFDRPEIGLSVKELEVSNFTEVTVFPNPSDGAITVGFELAEKRSVNFSVLGTGGRVVRNFGSVLLPSGSHSFVWDGKNRAGETTLPGIYFLRLSDGQDQTIKKVIIR